MGSSEILPKRKTGKFYHGTSADLLDKIRTEGLKCACEPGMGASKDYCEVYDSFGIVCLTTVPKQARFYSVVTAHFTRGLERDALMVVEVEPGCLEPSMLKARKSLTRKRPIEFDYKLNIPPECLKFYQWDEELRDFVRIL